MRRLANFIYGSRVLAGIHTWSGLLPRRIRLTGAVLRLTHNCQARCIICDYWRKDSEDHISTDKAIQILNRLADLGVQDIYFSGGEPLLRRDLFEILRRADTKRFHFLSIQTNGLLLNKLHNEINDSPVTNVSISIDALGERNDWIRGVKGYFDLSLEGAKLLRGKDVVITTNLTGPGADDLEGIIEITERHKWRFSYNLLDNRSPNFEGCDVESVWPNPSETEKIISVLRERLNPPEYELEYVEKYLLRGAPKDGPDEPPCFRGFNMVGITSDGNVWSGCSILPPMGNIFKTDIKQIIGSDAYRDRCLAMLRRECPGCACRALENEKAANRFPWLVKGKNRFFSWGLTERVSAAKALHTK